MEDKICGYHLDTQQQAIILDESKHLLVIAGAGSGKTLTILGKIYYLVKYKNILPEEILCISFTRESSKHLKEKIRTEFSFVVPVYTFHKLALEILKNGSISYEVSDPDTLDHLIHTFFHIHVLDYPNYMKKILRYFKVRKVYHPKKQYLFFLRYHNDKIEILEKLLATFLRLFKCNHFSLQDFPLFLKSSRRQLFNLSYPKEKIFLSIALNILLMYQSYLKENNEIDFDDMIIYATDQVKRYGLFHKIKYVIVDEYQDTSYIRFLLIKSILDHTNAKLMVVGDDFQSIYRFTGCDISLFLDFSKHFDDAKIMKIENTYRNSQELVKIASRFIMRNRSQVKKELKSKKHLAYPIKIVYYQNIEKTFFDLVLRLYEEKHTPILVLGRNNHDIEMVLKEQFQLQKDGKIICLLHKEIEIYYLTIHRSKGLEEENVIIINLEDKLLGLPNQIKDDKVLRFVSRSFESYPYSEERRLFYVALTRTKNEVYLLVPFDHHSIFVDELLSYEKKRLQVIKRFSFYQK